MSNKSASQLGNKSKKNVKFDIDNLLRHSEDTKMPLFKAKKTMKSKEKKDYFEEENKIQGFLNKNIYSSKALLKVLKSKSSSKKTFNNESDDNKDNKEFKKTKISKNVNSSNINILSELIEIKQIKEEKIEIKEDKILELKSENSFKITSSNLISTAKNNTYLETKILNKIKTTKLKDSISKQTKLKGKAKHINKSKSKCKDDIRPVYSFQMVYDSLDEEEFILIEELNIKAFWYYHPSSSYVKMIKLLHDIISKVSTINISK